MDGITPEKPHLEEPLEPGISLPEPQADNTSASGVSQMAPDTREPGKGLPIAPGSPQSVSGPISAGGINVMFLVLGCIGVVVVIAIIVLLIHIL